MILTSDLILRMCVSIVLGGAIGYERELREQPAGLRTHLLVALGAATFILVSTQFAFYQNYPAKEGLIRVDGGRIASNVVVGIGFLGGGAILRSGIRIKGLTTAASLWLVAAIGLASGAGMYVAAVTATLLTLFALVVLRFLLEESRKRFIDLTVRIELDGEVLTRTALVNFIQPVETRIMKIDYSRDVPANRSTVTVNLRLSSEMLEETLMTRLEGLPGIRRLSVERPEA